MIIVKLMGGLGNQMFQYATGRRLAHIYGTELKLDHSFLESAQAIATPRNYELHHLNVQCGRARDADLSAVALYGLKGLRRWLMDFLPLPRQLSCSHRIIRENSFRFDPAILDLPDNVYLEGYWQSERYFSDIAGILRDEFSARTPLAGENQQIADAINGCCAVSLHVRRGDYVSDRQTAAFHGVCGLDYYERGVEMITGQVSTPHFFIFSDDIAWAREHLRLNHPVTFVNNNPSDRGGDDLRLMSLCRHHIIANSSFSWWGAWLNARPDKIVVAPARWFNDPTIDTADLVPESWQKVAV